MISDIYQAFIQSAVGPRRTTILREIYPFAFPFISMTVFWLVRLLMFDYGFLVPSLSVVNILSCVIKGSRRHKIH